MKQAREKCEHVKCIQLIYFQIVRPFIYCNVGCFYILQATVGVGVAVSVSVVSFLYLAFRFLDKALTLRIDATLLLRPFFVWLLEQAPKLTTMNIKWIPR